MLAYIGYFVYTLYFVAVMCMCAVGILKFASSFLQPKICLTVPAILIF